MSSLITFRQYLFGSPLCLPLIVPTISNLTHLLSRSSAPLLFTCPSYFSLALSYSPRMPLHAPCLGSLINSNLISPSMPTHRSQHPHFHNLHLPNMRALDWLILRLKQQNQFNHHSIELTFKIWCYLFIT